MQSLVSHKMLNQELFISMTPDSICIDEISSSEAQILEVLITMSLGSCEIL